MLMARNIRGFLSRKLKNSENVVHFMPGIENIRVILLSGLIVLMSVNIISAGDVMNSAFVPVSEQDLLYRRLLEFQGEILARYEKSDYTVSQFAQWKEIKSEILEKLFPDHRFFSIQWSESLHPDQTSEAHVIAQGYGLSVNLALKKDGKDATELNSFGNYEEFGQLLAKANVRLLNYDDARLIWDGFCEANMKPWKDQGIEQINDTTWDLGVISINGVRYYYRLLLDRDGKVLSGNLQVDQTGI